MFQTRDAGLSLSPSVLLPMLTWHLVLTASHTTTQKPLPHACMFVCVCARRDSLTPESRIAVTCADLRWGHTEVGLRDAWHFSLQHLTLHITGSENVSEYVSECVRTFEFPALQSKVLLCVFYTFPRPPRTLSPSMLQCADSRDSFIKNQDDRHN